VTVLGGWHPLWAMQDVWTRGCPHGLCITSAAAASAAWGFPLSDLPGLVPPALPWWAMLLVLWRTCPRVTYFPHYISCLCLSRAAAHDCS